MASNLSPTQLAWRGRIEAGLRLAAPFLDLMLAAGDRLARTVDRDELDAAPPARVIEERRTTLSQGQPTA